METTMETNEHFNMSAGDSDEQGLVHMARYPALQSFSSHYITLHGYLAMAVCIWGIVANMANILVLTRRHMLTATNTILTWLAVADLMTMLSYLPIAFHFYIMKNPAHPFPSSASLAWILFMLFHISFAVVCHTIAIWLTITLAIFRYIFIRYPQLAIKHCTLERVKLAITCVYLSTIVLCIPHYLSTKYFYIVNRSSGGNSSVIEDQYYTIHLSSFPLIQNLNFWIHSILFKLIPCVLLTLLTLLLIIAMHKANRLQRHLKSQGKGGESERERETQRTSKMLLAIVTLFLITELPQGILTLCSIFIPWFFTEVYTTLGDLLDITALLNNSINFVLYCTMSRQFRSAFIQLFGVKKLNHSERQHMLLTTNATQEA